MKECTERLQVQGGITALAALWSSRAAYLLFFEESAILGKLHLVQYIRNPIWRDNRQLYKKQGQQGSTCGTVWHLLSVLCTHLQKLNSPFQNNAVRACAGCTLDTEWLLFSIVTCDLLPIDLRMICMTNESKRSLSLSYRLKMACQQRW